MTTPSNPTAAAPQESSKAVLALVLSIVSWVTCGLLMSIPSLILSRQEIKGIEAGRRSHDKRSLAQAAFWISTANIAVSALMIPVVLLGLPTVLGGHHHDRTRSDMSKIAQAIARMRADTGNTTDACLLNLNNLVAATSPTACGEFQYHCTEAPPGQSCWGGPYFTQIFPDRWGHPYSVTVDPVDTAIWVRSNGPDGVANTKDDLSYVQ